MEHSEDFIPPEAHELGSCGEAGGAGQEQPFSHPGQVPQVEDVMEAGWRGWQLLYDVGVQVQGQPCQASSST